MTDSELDVKVLEASGLVPCPCWYIVEDGPLVQAEMTYACDHDDGECFPESAVIRNKNDSDRFRPSRDLNAAFELAEKVGLFTTPLVVYQIASDCWRVWRLDEGTDFIEADSLSRAITRVCLKVGEK